MFNQENQNNSSNINTNQLILDLKQKIEENFNESDWSEVGLLTNMNDLIENHPRLLRSLYWEDNDYAANIINILKEIHSKDSNALKIIGGHIDRKYPAPNTVYVSTQVKAKTITFSPSVFTIPEGEIENDLIAVMMPFSGFDSVYDSIKKASGNAGFRCLRADDIWNNSTIIQDIFDLIFRARVVIVDFSGKNPNVMYETGIAHTLGKLVIPIAQSVSDIPSDMIHHRSLIYLKNGEGLKNLESELCKKLTQLNYH
ncbi:hypothetical protein [Acinetobacter lwoffii]|uniref:hypothetical protein n=1 Tax=Acinetobacter lwoffii TaxID=28090 RepID=UPI00209BAB6C|nr:hypothetical protein [Acinetobacter lwoffii]MCO8061841.1 hypothetical protein [Acinetobacter lwoffii]